MARIVNRENEFTLAIALATSDGSIPTDADATPSAVITSEATGTTIVSFSGTQVAHPDTGSYVVTWTPTIAGAFRIVWTFLVDGSPFQQAETFTVLSVSSGTGGGETSEPQVGYDQTCRVTATFLNARGDGVGGVHVRFTPRLTGAAIRTLGILARESTATSAQDGSFTMYLVRDMAGTLAISGIGVVREVTIPDEESVDLFALVSEAPEPLTVQTAVTTPLPRRTLT